MTFYLIIYKYLLFLSHKSNMLFYSLKYQDVYSLLSYIIYLSFIIII